MAGPDKATVRSAALRLAGAPLPVLGTARIYTCGITPYDVTHLGHAATFVWVDAAERVLRRLGVHVEVCRNVTDVDDVLFDAATKAVVIAFQRHWRPEKVDGIADGETRARLIALLRLAG